MQELRAGHVYSSRPWTGTAAADLLFLTPPATPQLREAGAAVRIRCVGIRESRQPRRKVYQINPSSSLTGLGKQEVML